MQKLVLYLMEMSLNAVVAAVVVLVLRFFLRKLPKSYSCVLWLLVLFRLLCPVTITSSLSLMPDAGFVRETSVVTKEAEAKMQRLTEEGMLTNAAAGTKAVQDFLKEEKRTDGGYDGMTAGSRAGAATVSAGHIRTLWNGKRMRLQRFWVKWGSRISLVWAAGAGLLAGFYLWEQKRLRRRIGLEAEGRLWCRGGLPSESSLSREAGGRIFESRLVPEPFVCGFFRPVICLPAGMEEQERAFILCHERMHIRHGDPQLRILWQIALILHWFNPVVWLILGLVHRDMEMYCDESVMRQCGTKERQNYAMTLLRFSVKKSGLPFPVAFGESNTEGRIKHILKMKKPAAYLSIAVMGMIAVAAAVLLTDPKGAAEGENLTETQGIAEEERTSDGTVSDQSEENSAESSEPSEAANNHATDVTKQPSRAEQMLEIGGKWADAYCARDGRAMAALLADPKTMEKNGYIPDENGFYEVGWSSPWPGTGEYRLNYAYEKDEVVIYYYAFTSAPPIYYVWVQTLLLEQTEDGYAIGDWKTEADPIDSAEAFRRAYHNLPQEEYGLSEGNRYRFKNTPLDYFHEKWPDDSNAETIAEIMLGWTDPENLAQFLQPADAAAMQLQLKGGKAVPVDSPWENRYCLRWEFADGQTDVICLRPLEETQELGPWAVEDILNAQEYETMLGQARLRKRYLENPELLDKEALGGTEKMADAIAADSAILKLAALPEDAVALYGMVVEGVTEGVFLETAGEVRYFDWIYMTAQALPPEIALRDFDGDKEKELAVFLHVLSGTECSIEQLLMLKKEAGGAWGVTEFAVEEIQEELAQDISWRFTDKESVLEFYETETGRVIGEEKLTEILETGETLDSVSFGNVMDFDTGDAEGEESEIRLNFEIRYGVEGDVIGRYGAHFISAQVHYDGSSFALEDYLFFTRGMFGSKTE